MTRAATKFWREVSGIGQEGVWDHFCYFEDSARGLADVDKQTIREYAQTYDEDWHLACREVLEQIRAFVRQRINYYTYPQMSHWQRAYLKYIAENPGCTAADVDRACRRNPNAGHRVYEGIRRLAEHGALRREKTGSRFELYVEVSRG